MKARSAAKSVLRGGEGIGMWEKEGERERGCFASAGWPGGALDLARVVVSRERARMLYVQGSSHSH